MIPRLIIFFVIINSISLTGFSQNLEKEIIFDWTTPENDMWISIDSTFEKFTPTIEQVNLARQISFDYIDSLEQSLTTESVEKYGEILDFEFDEYYRQYVGYIDSTGKKIIFINACCLGCGSKEELIKNWIFVFDGGSRYYQTEVDLDSKKCISFSTNGEA